jgi:hypothetical protein
MFTLSNKETISPDCSSLKTAINPFGEISENGGENNKISI